MTTQMLVVFFMVSLSFLLPLIISPLLMGMWVLLMALMLSFMFGLMTMSWFGLILFLVYIGGMLVMFIYFVAVTPNQWHNMKVLVLLFILIALFLYGEWEFMKLIFQEGLPQKLMSEIMLFSMSQGMVLIMIFIMLFISLVVVVKITKLVFGPFRPFN